MNTPSLLLSPMLMPSKFRVVGGAPDPPPC
jgi:hypothetical protein